MHEIDKQTILDLVTSIDNLTSAITCLEKDSRPNVPIPAQNTNQRRVASLQKQSRAIAYIDKVRKDYDDDEYVSPKSVRYDLDEIREILLS